ILNLLASSLIINNIVYRLLCSATFSLAAATSVLAQAAPDPPTPVRPAAKGTAGPAERTAPADANDPGVTLQFPNSDVADVLRFYDQLTGKNLLRDNFVQAKLSFVVSE